MSFKINPATLHKIREDTAICFGISFRQELEESGMVSFFFLFVF
jgi:hypothetical protein